MEKGERGHVIKIRYKSKDFAIKCYDSSKDIRHEWDIINKIKNIKYVPRYYNINYEKKRIYMDYISPGITLESMLTSINHDKISSRNDDGNLFKLSSSDRLTILYQLIQFLIELKSINITHGDFKAKNMIWDGHKIYVFDWDLSSDTFIPNVDIHKFKFLIIQLVKKCSYKKALSYSFERFKNKSLYKLLKLQNIEDISQIDLKEIILE